MSDNKSLWMTFGLATGTLLLFWYMDKKRNEKSEDDNGGTVTVSELNVYPIKSCAEVSVQSAMATSRGFEYDRMAQVTDKNKTYCTPREEGKRKLFHVKVVSLPANTDEKRTLTLSSPHAEENFSLDVDGPTTTVTTKVLGSTGDQEHTLQDYGDDVATWLQKATSIPDCRLTGIGETYTRSVCVNPDQGDDVPTSAPAPVSLADEAPYLLTNASSLVDLNKRLVKNGKSAIDMRRFRPNIVLTGLQPWEEDCLSKIQIGNVQFNVWQRCGRCIMTTIDRDSLERKDGPEPLKTLTEFRERANGQRNFGMHLVPAEGCTDGKICVGDAVTILEYDEERKKEWMRLFLANA
mmetsp:Transcript_17005/g.24102  ORF Transcript_17005/g.24102 Transcript_17005/m.24102 type:complete len:350 (-) Transcript_17005:32-1081(-)